MIFKVVLWTEFIINTFQSNWDHGNTGEHEDKINNLNAKLEFIENRQFFENFETMNCEVKTNLNHFDFCTKSEDKELFLY